MRVQLDDKHFLCADKYCCWVMQEVEKKKGEPGTYEVRVTGYHRTFEELVEDYISSEFMAAEAETLQDLVKKLKALKKEVRGWNKNRNASK